MKTLNVYNNGKWEEVVASPAGLEDYAKTEYVDAAIKASRDEGAIDFDAVQTQVLFAIEETGKQTQAKIAL